MPPDGIPAEALRRGDGETLDPGRRRTLAAVLAVGNELEDRLRDLITRAQDRSHDPLARAHRGWRARAEARALDGLAEREREGLAELVQALIEAAHRSRSGAGAAAPADGEAFATLARIMVGGAGSTWVPALHREVGRLLAEPRAAFLAAGIGSAAGPGRTVTGPDGYRLSLDPTEVDVDLVHRFLSEQSYWAAGRTRDVVERSIAGSAVVVSAHNPTGEMVAFARVVSDRATFAWLADVFVLEDHRGHGLGEAVCRAAVDHPDVIDVKRHLLATADAHELYRRLGFEPLEDAGRWMTRRGAGT